MAYNGYLKNRDDEDLDEEIRKFAEKNGYSNGSYSSKRGTSAQESAGESSDIDEEIRAFAKKNGYLDSRKTAFGTPHTAGAAAMEETGGRKDVSNPWWAEKASGKFGTAKDPTAGAAAASAALAIESPKNEAEQQQAYDEYLNALWAARERSQKAGLSSEQWYEQAKAEADRLGDESHKAMGWADKMAPVADYARQMTRAAGLLNPAALPAALGTYLPELLGRDKTREQTPEQKAAAEAYEAAKKELGYASVWRWQDVIDDPEFAVHAAEGLADVDARKEAAYSAANRPIYDANGPDGGFAAAVERERTLAPLRELPTDEWTEDQRNLYGFLHWRDRQNGTNQAAEYGRGVNDAIAKASRNEQIKTVEDSGNGALALHTLLARGANLLSGGDYLADLAEYAALGYVPERDFPSFTDYGRAVDSQVTQRLNKAGGTLPDKIPVIGGKGWGDAAGMGLSAVDSYLSAMVGGEAGGLALMGLRSASNGYADAKERGVDDKTALTYGAICGAAEVAFEKISIENLLDTDKMLTRGFLKSILVQGGLEMSEEMATTLATTIADVAVLKENGELESSIRDLMASGMTQEEATRKALLHAAEGMLYDGLAGFGSGGLMMGVNSLVRLPGTASTGQKILDAGDAQAIIDAARGSENQALRQLADDMANGKVSQSAHNLGRLVGVMQALDADLVDSLAGRSETAAQPSTDQQAPEAAAQKTTPTERAPMTPEQTTPAPTQPKQPAEAAQTTQPTQAAAEPSLAEQREQAIQTWMWLAGATAAEAAQTVDWRYQQYGTYDMAEAQRVQNGERLEEIRAQKAEQAQTAPLGLDAPWDIPSGTQTAQESQTEQEKQSDSTESQSTRETSDGAAGEEIESAFAVLGEDAKATEAVYREGQDADKYAAAMNAGINLMAAEGTNREALDKSNLTEYLTKEQRDIAWEIGHEKYLARQQKAAEQTRRGGEREVSEIREGTVSWDGATIEGRQYAAVDRKTLSRAEQRQANASATVAKALGVDLVFFDADPQEAQGAYREGGTIYLNVRAGKSSGETLIVSAFSHELTHFAEEYGGTAYEELRGYVMQTLAGNDQTKFEQIVEAKRRSRGNISYEEALSEVVADGCEMMLRDTNAPEMLARENPTLLRQICEWLDGWVKKIKEAFTGVSARHEEARILMEQAEELQRRWDKALAEAVQNREAMRGENETTAEDGGRVQYSKDQNFSQADIDTLRSIRASHQGSGRISIFDFTGQDIRKAEKWAKQFYREMGTKSPFFRNWFGDWRANDKNGVRYIEMKNNTVNQKSRAVYNKDMSKTEEKGASINIGKDFFEDSLHYAKQGKDEKAITKLLANIDEVVENAVLLDTQLSELSSKNKKGSTQFMHILYSPISYNGAPFLAKITVEEYREDGVLRAYNAQRITMSALPRSYFQQLNQAASAGASRLHADEIMVSQLFDLVKQYDKDFKARPAANPELLNSDGTPRMVYHSTDVKNINVFQSGNSAGLIYFAFSESDAKAAARGTKYVRPYYLSAQSPVNTPDTAINWYDAEDSVKAAQWKRAGHDAVFVKDEAGVSIAVFSPEQAKSATDNIGTFDRSNPDVRYSERDNSVSDRELLREAAEREGASDELKKYGKKADNLEAYQKRLERQQKKLTAEGLGAEERAALEKRIEETEGLIARTQDALTRMELRPSMQQTIQEARTRWWSENIPDAVQTAREIQKENRELREAVQYYREQAQHTAPENRGVDKADVRRFARALLKEHGSSADVEQLSRQIQKLGEKLVQGTGDDLNSRELNGLARGAARMIVDEVYTDINEGTADVLSGLSERVRGTRLQITDDLRADIPDLNAWRKARLGRMTLVNEGGTSIDELYQDLRYEYGEGYFPADVTAASDQLEQIDRALDSLKPNYQYAFTEMERDEAVRLVSQEIMDTVLSGEIREAETIADRNYRKMQERMLTAREAQHKAERKAASAERRADNAEKTALRQAREEQKAITREKVKNLRQELNESREAQQKRINIERQRARLSRMLRENSAKNHVPESLRGQIGRFIQSLDTLGPFSEGTKSEARFREEMKELGLALRSVKDSTELNDFYGDMELTEGVRVMLQNNIDQVEAAISGNEGTVTRRMTLEQLRALEETLNVLSTAIKNVNELLSDGEHRFAHIDELGEEAIRENYAISEKKQAGGEIGRQLKWANLTPYYAFKRFGETGREIFRGITRGWGKMARNIEQVQKFAEETYTAEEARSWERKEHSFKLVPRAINPDSESAVKSGSMDLKADAVDVTMTEAQIMSLYCLNKREQARGHLYGAGIRIGDYQIGNRKPTTQSEHYLLDPDDMATIIKTLSPRQIEVCDALTKYMNTVGSSWGNKVSMKLYGIRGFTEENYFPIRTDSTQHKAKTADSERGNLFRLANQSFTKQLTKNANNAIILDSVFDVFADHMADMGKYNAMVLPMLDAMRWFNYQGEKSSVQQALQRAFGSDAGHYFKDFMQDLNGASEGGRGEQVFSRMMSGVKVASVGANLRVALQQPTSIARAALLLNPKYLVAGAATKGGRAKALQYSGLAVWKDLGYFDVNVNRGMREQIKHADTLKQRIQNKSLVLAEKGDRMTWGALWNACELETADKTGLTGEELMQKTAARFDEVILATQVMDSTLTRSSNMRSKSVMMKEFTAFMAEPTLTYNMLLDTWSEFDKIKRTRGTTAAINQMKGQALRTASVYVMSAALTAVAQAIGDAGRDDDDYETWLQKFWQHWTEDFTDNLNPMKLVPIVQDLWNMIVEKKDKNLLVLQPVQQGRQVWNIWKEWYELKTGKIARATETTWYGKMTAYGRVYKTLQFISSMTGLPLGSATREFQAGYNTFLRPLLNETWGRASGKELPKWRTYDGGPQQQIKSAWEGGFLDEEQAKTLLLEEGVAKDETEAGKTVYKWGIGNTAAYKAVKEAAVKGDEKGYREAMKAMTDAGYSEADVQSQVRTAIKEQYLQPESGLELSKAYCIDYLQRFGGMSREEAETTAQEWTCYKVTGIAYDDIEEAYRSGEISAGRALELSVTYGPATTKMNQGWTEHAKPAGVDSASYYRFWLEAGEMRSDRDADGKEIKGQKKQDKVMAYIDGLRLTNAQKDALYLSMYVEKNLKNAPWNK